LSLDVRYLTEDIPTGLVPLSSIGKYISISTPNINSVIVLANTLLNKNFYKSGRTIENYPVLKSLLIKKWVSKDPEYSSNLLQTQNSVFSNNFE